MEARREWYANEDKVETPDLTSYDHIIVAFSGGKDSAACVLHLIEQGVDMTKVELWHHLVDGREGSKLMDWPVTEDYCRRFAAELGLPIYYSWKQGGFEGEMLRENQRTKPTSFEHMEDNMIECGVVGGKRGKESTRRKFPQVSADLSVRWCSAYLKVQVCESAIYNQERFRDKRTLVITGERAEESAARAKYQTFEPDRTDKRDSKKLHRHVDHWRPVHAWSEQQVWDIIKRHGIMPHPAYRLGWGRLSCMACIFGSSKQWASIQEIAPKRLERIAEYEQEFGLTIHRTKAVMERVAEASPYDAIDPAITRMALSEFYYGRISVDPETWQLPAGAFGDSAGPS